MDKQSKIIAKVVGIEGGYVNDASDSGGKTKWGITKEVARNFGYMGNMKHLPQDTAIDIYKRGYWHKVSGNHLLLAGGVQLAEEVFEQAVNMGVVRAVKNIQTVLNALNRLERDYPDVTVDGVMGKQTAQSLVAFRKNRGVTGIKVLTSYLNALQGAFYIGLSQRREKDERFMYGWGLNRVVNHAV